eukprot:7541970-Prorocentrum_lima.AAC.1
MAVLGLAKLRGLWQIVHDEDTYSYSGPATREPHLVVTRYLEKACASGTWPCAATPGQRTPVLAQLERQP